MAIYKEVEGSVYKLRGRAQVETTELLLQADEIDYDTDKNYAEARGHVIFDKFNEGEHLEADRVEYNLKEETGRYYDLSGISPAKMEAKPGILSTNNPFVFEGKWAERRGDRYIVHDGMLTDCRLPKPWWTINGPIFDVIPNDRAVARNAIFRLRGFPLFYFPYYYKSLQKSPRHSGLLVPNIGNSSRRGFMFGTGYYWAISRNYDATYRVQYFSSRGFAHNVDFRGKPTEHSDYNFTLFGLADRGIKKNGTLVKQGGYFMTFDGKTDLGGGFSARASINYLSSFEFRQNFTESFYEAIYSESHSVAYVTKHWSTYGLNTVFTQNENFLNDDRITIRKLPSLEFSSDERLISRRIVPLYFSFESSGALLSRNQNAFTTSQAVDRLDAAPRLTTSIGFEGVRLTPSFALEETHYGSQVDRTGATPRLLGDQILRSAKELDVELSVPSLARVYKAPKMLGDKLKHVIEVRGSYRYVTGVNEFNRTLRFDEVDLLSNTNEAEVSVANRLLVKRSDGKIDEIVSLEVTQRRFFDPTFGGAVRDGFRNVVLSSATLTGYAFIFSPRNYSPIVSVLRINPVYRFNLEWRTDYDPLYAHIANSSLSVDTHIGKYSVSFGQNQVRVFTSVQQDPALRPDDRFRNTNQLRGLLGYGQDNRHGWSFALTGNYDYTKQILQYAAAQATYNTDCCGFSLQYRHSQFGTLNDNQYRLAFAVANFGSFGTLKKQEKIF